MFVSLKQTEQDFWEFNSTFMQKLYLIFIIWDTNMALVSHGYKTSNA